MIGQLWRTPAPGSLLMTNGWSSMGFGIPAAIAAKLCLPDRPVACVVGDGGFLMMVGEMATAKRLGVSVVFVLLTDHSLAADPTSSRSERAMRSTGRPCTATATIRRTLFSVFRCFRHVTPRPIARRWTEAFAAGGPVIVEAFVDPKEYG